MTMYIHHMHRTQLYLDREMHGRLCDVARRQGRTVSDLVREAVAQTYGLAGSDERENSLQAIQGLWRDRELGDTDAYVRRLRRDTRRTPRRQR